MTATAIHTAMKQINHLFFGFLFFIAMHYLIAGPLPHILITAQQPSDFLCIASQADYSITALTFCYAWPQRPLATQANYNITALIFVMHGHKALTYTS